MDQKGRTQYRAITLIAMVASLTGCIRALNYLDPQGPRFAGSFANGTVSATDTLTVVSFNIKYAKHIEPAIAALQALPEADIILLQEMDESGTAAIAQALACNYVYYPGARHPWTKKNFGNAILSKHSLRDAGKLALPYSVMGTGMARIAVSAVVELDTEEILVLSVHTATAWLGEEKRLQQFKAVLASVNGDYEHVVIGGDFNTLTQESFRAMMYECRARGFERASVGAEPTAKVGPLVATLDHLIVKGLNRVAAGTYTKNRASDHFPVWVKLTKSENGASTAARISPAK